MATEGERKLCQPHPLSGDETVRPGPGHPRPRVVAARTFGDASGRAGGGPYAAGSGSGRAK